MWKRLQGHVREKEKQIGNPVLLETTYDEDQLRHIPTVSDAQTHSQPSRNTFLQDPRDYRVSEVPTVSSVYSQPSPELHHANPPRSQTADVSPPSSPEPDAQHDSSIPRRFRSMRDVSPVDEERGTPPSNIPVLRKAPSGIRDKTPTSTQKFWGGKVAPNSKVRWDEYSGEPTSSNAGKSAQVSPGTYAKETEQRRPMGYHVSVSGGHDNTKKQSERASRVSTRPPPVDTTLTKSREPWKGASGRVEIVQPFKDQPTKQPRILPRKPDPRIASGSARAASNPLAGPIKRVPVPTDTPAVADGLEEFDTREDPIKPIVPLKVGRNTPPRSIASPTTPNHSGIHTLASPASLRSPVDQATSTNTPANNPAKPSLKSTHETSTPASTKTPTISIENTPGSTASKDNGPASRFSWTTYNTNTTYQQSPPPSPPPPLPLSNPGQMGREPMSAASSILNRRRPVPVADKLPAKTPTTEAASRPITMASFDPPSPRPLSTFSTNTQKALPRPPPEMSAADHVDTLKAQMEDLNVRRKNVYRLLQDLYNMAPPNPLVTDFKRMRLVDKRKKDFEDELAEIKREEHEVGLKLHRAYRKRENADPGSESAIWIRRVTR